MLSLDAALVCLAAVVTRFVWVFPVTYIPRKFSHRLRQQGPSPPWQNVTVTNRIRGHTWAVSLLYSRYLSPSQVGTHFSHLLCHRYHSGCIKADPLAHDPVVRSLG